MQNMGDDPAQAANDLRKQLVKLKIDTLKAQAMRMGLKVPGEEISAAAMKEIERSVVELNHDELKAQIAHWTDLSRRSTK